MKCRSPTRYLKINIKNRKEKQMIILYSNDCKNCKLLKSRLDLKNVQYEISNDMDFLIQKGFKSVPILKKDDQFMTFFEAIQWLKEI